LETNQLIMDHFTVKDIISNIKSGKARTLLKTLKLSDASLDAMRKAITDSNPTLNMKGKAQDILVDELLAIKVWLTIN
jgi:hypothetical protein